VRTVFAAIVFFTAIYAVAEAQQPPASGKKSFQQAIDDIEEAGKSSATDDSKRCFDVVMPHVESKARLQALEIRSC